ncbi:MAG: hydrolase [Epulopiscium sp.]|nr:hydrolase [Candidatus Epulonipiscium sp.]
MKKQERFIPEVNGTLRKTDVKVPEVIRQATGIYIFGKRLRSFLFSTDVAIIKNTNADAIIAVYPFTPQPAITQAIMSVADIPVLCGVGGGLTNGIRSVNIALHAEFQGAIGVVLNAPTPNDTIQQVSDTVDVPVVITVVSEKTNIQEKLDAGAKILNISGGSETINIVQTIRKEYPHVPIIATGGPTAESILKTIEAGANAITYTPPSNGELFRVKMDLYREQERKKYNSL